MYKQGGGAGLDRKRISDALDKHLEKAVAAAAAAASPLDVEGVGWRARPPAPRRAVLRFVHPQGPLLRRGV
ncbi:hypothetical protein ABZP36_002563 [Zizania latifolia]